MLVRAVQVLVAGLTLLVIALAYGSGPSSSGVQTVAAGAAVPDSPLPTTAPVGVPVQPTPTPFDIPPADAEPAVAVPQVDDEPSGPQSTSVATPTSQVAAAGEEDNGTPIEPAPSATTVPSPTQAPSPTQEPSPTPAPSTAPAAADPTPPSPSGPHVVTEVGYLPLGQSGGVALVLPVARIELIGFHEAGHPGSQAINAAGTGVPMITLSTRGRGTSARSAADIVVPPDEPVLAPVTGTVVASSSYVLYCKHDDQLVYIEPDGFPGWQVRLFHVEGRTPPVGSRVLAGESVVARSARALPFESQIDEHTAEPSWPHVHLEVIDTSVPDTRPPGPGCP